MIKDFRDFLAWEKFSRDTIDFKKTYVDIANSDVISGLVLSELIYWYLPNNQGSSKLRVSHDGSYWVAVTREEWWQRCRLTPRQADRALNILVDCCLLEKRVFRYNGSPVTHVRVRFDTLISKMNELGNLIELPTVTEKIEFIESKNEAVFNSSPIMENSKKADYKTPSTSSPAIFKNKNVVSQKVKVKKFTPSLPAGIPKSSGDGDWSETRYSASTVDAETLYRKVRPSHFTVPRSEKFGSAMEILIKYLEKYKGDFEAAADALRPFAEEADRRNISQLNLCWLTEWAAAGVMPSPAKNKGKWLIERSEPVKSLTPKETSEEIMHWEWIAYDPIIEYVKSLMPWEEFRKIGGSDVIAYFHELLAEKLPEKLEVGQTLRVEFDDESIVEGEITNITYSTLHEGRITHITIGDEELSGIEMIYAKVISRKE